jgi:hypothetical protein
MERKPEIPQPETAEVSRKEEAPKEETSSKPKAQLEDLDEKLNELLEETPE